MKLVLVGVNSKFVHSNLAIRYLKAYTKEINFDCDILEFSINDRIERVVESIMYEKPSIVAFSCYIWNISYIQQLAVLIKLIDNNVKILYGGPEVSFESEQFLLTNSVDYIIEGEGEETFKEFVLALLEGMGFDKIKGLYYKVENEIKYGGKRPLMDINMLIFPYSKDEDLNNKIIYYEGARGCPFNCKYCLSSTIHGVRFLEIERIKKDLKALMDKNVRLVKFVDRTFNCSSKFAMEVWEYLMSLDTETTFHFEISADILKDEQLELLKNAPKGRFQFEIGVQTTNNEILKNINRFVAFDDIKKQVNILNSYGNIKQHLDLIAGLPGENLESFKKSFNDLYNIKPDEIQLGFLKILKGSPMKDEIEKWGIVHSPYGPYEVIKTKDISYDELILLKKVEEMVDKYYNSRKFMSILEYFIPKFNTPFDFYLSLGIFFNRKGYFNRSLASAEYYKVFLEFNLEELYEDSESLKEIIKYEFLKFNRKKYLPNFMNKNIDKQTERKLKEAVKNKLININYINYNIEKFNLNIYKFIEKGQIEEGNFYYVFDEDNIENITEITYIINKDKILD